MAMKKFCLKQGCNKLVDTGYCEQHQSEAHAYDQYRESAAKRGYDHRWRKTRLQHLKKHPLCVDCMKEGKITPATDVDHIIAHKGDKQLFWDRNNWASRCHSHHSRKTVREDGGFGRTKGRG